MDVFINLLVILLRFRGTSERTLNERIAAQGTIKWAIQLAF